MNAPEHRTVSLQQHYSLPRKPITSNIEAIPAPISEPICCQSAESHIDDSSKGANPDHVWKEMLEQLQHYKAEHGDCLVPCRYAQNRKLGFWVMTQRRQFNLLKSGKQSALTSERVDALEHLGFAWKVRDDKEEVWSRRLRELEQYKARHGDCLVPQRFPPNPALGTWVNTQRRHYKLLKSGRQSSMTEARIQSLQAMGFEFIVRYDARKKSNLEETKSSQPDVPCGQTEKRKQSCAAVNQQPLMRNDKRIRLIHQPPQTFLPDSTWTTTPSQASLITLRPSGVRVTEDIIVFRSPPTFPLPRFAP